MHLRSAARSLLVTLALTAPACGPADDSDDVETSSEALTTFTAQQCRAPAVTTAPLLNASTRRPIDGTARTTLDGCVLGRPNETGAVMTTRSTTLLGDTARFGALKQDDGTPVFSRFTPLAPTGSISSPSGQIQDIDVRLNMSFSPSARLRVTRRQNADGSYSLSIANITPFRATIAFFPVTVVKANNLTLEAHLRPEANGIGVRGTSQITLEHEKQQAANASVLVQNVFDWLTTELR
jgi:hypothetical protein